MSPRGVIAASALLLATLTGTSLASDTAKPMRWILNGPALAVFAHDPIAQRFFAGTKPFVVQRKDAEEDLPAAWGALPVRTYTSYAALKRALEAGAIGPSVRAIMYDNEAWRFTPPAEQRDPATYTRLAARLVHEHGLLFIAAPAVDLTRVLAPGPERRYDAYLRLGIAGSAARFADVFDIQAQGSEMGEAVYSSFVERAAAQARAANPKVIVIAGISTNPSGQRVTAATILHAIDATKHFVDGYWLNVPKPGPYCPGCKEFRPDIAIEVLRALGAWH
jgi:hypothetical protein